MGGKRTKLAAIVRTMSNAKKNPRQFSFGSSGVGFLRHVATNC